MIITKHHYLLSLCNCFFFAILANASNTKPNFQLSWPTPNPAFAKGMGYSAFLQKTGPGKSFSSGAFGCVRNNGYKFHEGLDLYPIKRDPRGRAVDAIYSAMPGIVSHVNDISGHSAYGRYIVLTHNQLRPALYSLYGHLASIDPGVKVGSRVNVAQEIGKMGNSASYSIPLNRSHLHFEIGLRLTNRFQEWYDRKSFSSKNRHGNYSGFNLVGIDPLPFYSEFSKKSFAMPIDYIKSLPQEAKIRVKTSVVPDFANRYPELIRLFPENKKWNGWECIFGPYGLPITLQQTDQCTSSEPSLRVISYDQQNDSRKCRKLVEKRNGKIVPAEQMKLYLELLFGFKLG
jgi:murein DD-endopeptidase MepM/ murein hydrolase activator NlpD